jgi:uncharacterized protein
MKSVFADTFFFLAAINPDDEAHAEAIAYSNEFHGELLTTAWVLTEVADALAKKEQRAIFKELFETLPEPRVRIIAATQILFEQGLRLYFARPDKDWSLTDCISFTVMKERKVKEALTGDRHFEQAGFTKLLR